MAEQVPILGVCLGHQAICEVYGAEIAHARQLMHGKKSTISLDNKCRLFEGLPRYIEGARYHSLAACKETVPALLQVIAKDETGEIMAVKHRQYEVYGVQFHPESILTPRGHVVLDNFLKL
jgi:anthranilate synthase component 2